MPRKRLTEVQIAEIRRLYSLRGSKTYNVGTLAGLFGVPKLTIWRYVRDLTPQGLRGRRGMDLYWDLDRRSDGPPINRWD